MKTLAEKIEVMQAALDGKEIEVNFNGQGYYEGVGWKVEVYFWDWRRNDYRIKEELCEKYLPLFSDWPLNHLYATREEAEEAGKQFSDYTKTVKMREVIE